MRPWCSGEEVCGGNDHFTCDVPDTRGMLFRSIIWMCLLWVSERKGGSKGGCFGGGKGRTLRRRSNLGCQGGLLVRSGKLLYTF